MTLLIINWKPFTYTSYSSMHAVSEDEYGLMTKQDLCKLGHFDSAKLVLKISATMQEG